MVGVIVACWHTFPLRYHPFALMHRVHIVWSAVHVRQFATLQATTVPRERFGPKEAGMVGVIVECWHWFPLRYQPLATSQPVQVV